MKLRFRFVRPFRDAVGRSEVELEVKGSVMPEVLEELVAAYPGLREHLYEDGALSPYVNIYVNQQAVDVGEIARARVKEGDELLFLLPLTGG